MSASDKVKAHADGYISACFNGPLHHRQEIDIRLAFYAGMLSMLKELEEISTSGMSNEDSVKEIAATQIALVERALRLNNEGAGR